MSTEILTSPSMNEECVPLQHTELTTTMVATIVIQGDIS